MRLYRGIAVPESKANEAVAVIEGNGLLVGGRFWSGLAVHDLKMRLEPLWDEPGLSLKLTRPNSAEPLARVCACVRARDALYYACSHNRKGEDTTPILITFDADPDDVVIDGRDFLYTVIQLGNATLSRKALERVFGTAVLRYADRAWASADQQVRIACADLAVQDPDVIGAHAANELVLGGRYRTRFSSAFMVRAPVPKERIASVERVDHRAYVLPDIDVALEQLLP
ncbi:hypothetical protein SAMN05216337_1007140 [Bradyrhizobium brasilense]|uniref:Uncharacterized protein n=1 Tax=Bradyrhizobium brasilense TaxID=1419277 RepID=A0A1G6RVX0_9BRAD|nr:hypothetical protein [Bradyrhizobium brasilense]SDD08544.1 hypothetical protein SAMN05216337_1007140 [Bradyrhizobium brasilense]